MTTKTAPRGSTTIATATAPRQAKRTRVSEPKSARTCALPKAHRGAHLQPNPADVLSGLFTTGELAELHARCKAMGRAPAEIVTTALRNWLATPADGREDSHLDNDTPPPEPPKPFDGILGEEIGRSVDKFGQFELIFHSTPFYHFVFEVREFYVNGKWSDGWDDEKWNGEQGHSAYLRFLETLPRECVRSKWVYEKSYDAESALEWFRLNNLTPPRTLIEDAAYNAETERDLEDQTRANERERIARGLGSVLSKCGLMSALAAEATGRGIIRTLAA